MYANGHDDITKMDAMSINLIFIFLFRYKIPITLKFGLSHKVLKNYKVSFLMKTQADLRTILLQVIFGLLCFNNTQTVNFSEATEIYNTIISL